MARVCHSLAACKRHTPSSLAAVIGLSNNDHFVTFLTLRALRWLETPLYMAVNESMYVTVIAGV